MCAEAGRRLRTCGDVREVGVPTWAGSGSRERGQYSNISEIGHYGSSWRHYVTSWRGAVRRRSSSRYYMALNVPTGEQQLPASSRSVRRRSEAKLRLCACYGCHMKQVWGAGALTLDGGSLFQLPVDMVWRVKWAKSAGSQGKQIWQEAKRFQANINYWSMYDVYELNYLGFFKVEWCLGVGEKSRKQKRIYIFRYIEQF